MPYSNGEIWAPVGWEDVRRALGEKFEDIGRLCRSEKINKWARYKPVVYPGFPIRFQSGITAFENKTGLSVSTAIDTPSSIANYEDFEISYERPTGNMSSPYRATDFAKYYHYAQAPAKIIWRNKFQMDKGFSCTVSIYDRSSAEDSESISFSDLMKEVSGYSGFKDKDKRLCLAIIDVASQDQTPFWYFFSETFNTVGSSGSWSVSTNMFNTNFTKNTAHPLTAGKTYKFVVMVVSNHSYLTEIPDSQNSRERWEYGVSAAEMASMESGSNPIQALSLALEKDADRTSVVLQPASVVTDRSYYLYSPIVLEKFGNNVVTGNYNKLCVQISMPTIIVRSLSTLNDSDRYQMRVRFSQNDSGTTTTIFQPTNPSGNNYYTIASTPSGSMNAIPVTPWVSVSDIGRYTETETDAAGRTVYVYEFDFPNRTYTITANNQQQTQNVATGLFLFFDQVNDFSLTFYLYYIPNGTQQVEQLVRTITVDYHISEGGGYYSDDE